MTGLGIILAHLAGDYLLQSHWMATQKTHRWWPAIAHGLTYTLPHLVVTQSAWALAVIGGSHILIDRYRLARHVVWAKNLLAPRGHRPRWWECKKDGYPASTPTGLATGLLIVSDNTIHLAINTGAVIWL